MSTKAMGRMYGSMTGGGGGMSTTGGTSLLDVITGNTPLNLQRGQQTFQSGEAEKERTHEKEIEAAIAQHAQDMEKLKAKIADEKASSDQVRGYLTSKGIADTPENRQRIASQLTDIDFQNAAQRANNELAANQSDEVKKATTRGRAAQELQPTVPLTKASQFGAPAGGIEVGKDYANTGNSLSTTPDVAKGSTVNQTTGMVPTYINPQTGQPMGFQPVTATQNNPGTFSPGGQRGVPLDPSIINSIMNNGSSQGMTPPDDGQGNPMAPIPANNQPSNGGAIQTPRLQTTPQPDPSTFSPIKGPLNSLLDWLMQGNQGSPFYTDKRFNY